MIEAIEIFKWTKDFEKIYEGLIDKAKEENLAEMQAFRENQEKLIEKTLLKKQEVVNLALKNISIEINNGISSFNEKLDVAMKKIERKYQKDKTQLIKIIIKKLELNF